MRDATMTTGAPWKSKKAGPNRIPRWMMLRSNAELKVLGIDMAGMERWVVAKLRDKKATYKNCMSVARRLAWCVYGMSGAPDPDISTKQYLEAEFGPIVKDSTGCLICKAPLDFALFRKARRGKAEIETAHAQPRAHTAGNVGFAHRHCNIAQGDKSLKEFYDWIKGILRRAAQTKARTRART